MRRLLLALLLLPALPAFAQGYEEDRVDKLERDIMTLQRQVARSGGGPVITTDEGLTASDHASLEVRLSNMEEEIRRLRGSAEENDFRARRLEESLSRFQKDVEFRFQELEKPAVPTDADTPPTSDAAPEELPKPSKAGTLKAPKEEDKTADDTTETGGSPRDQYNAAFRLMNQANYEAAGKAFQTFTEKHPKDPLVGNAYYWLGETHYVQKHYVQAADAFRAGFEAMPKGPKAADNLLKLAMTLSAMQKDKDACTVLGQILARFKDGSASVLQKAKAEKSRLGCK